MTNGWGTNQGGPGRPQGPAFPPQIQLDEPDWAALADEHEREQTRRKRLMATGGIVAAVVAVGGIAAVAATAGPNKPDAKQGAVVEVASQQPTASTSDGPDGPPVDSPSPSPGDSASPSASASGSPSPGASRSPAKSASKPATSAPPAKPGPPDPLTVISAAATDTAPITPGGVLPAGSLQINGKTWTRLTDDLNPTCYHTTTGNLGDVLAAQSCRAVLRVTYTSGNSAVTVGIAVMDSKAQADAVMTGFKGQLQGLVPSGHTSYCTSPGCTGTHAAIGRYAYFTVSGTVSPGGTTADAAATAAGPALADYARAQLLARGTAH
ncbi:hypothetical protein ACIQF6_02835 [Kitasatospora sp. NPDC092948]|uniref:hypothetical protein n=1 Tax=Kitasatospora sp. NPDC092948 TaxID=3364088 RepID=UPI0037F5BDF8